MSVLPILSMYHDRSSETIGPNGGGEPVQNGKSYIDSTNVDTVIRHIIQAIHHSLDIDDVFKEIATCLGKYLQADRCFISNYNRGAGILSPPTQEYLSSDNVESMIQLPPAVWKSLENFSEALCCYPGPVEFNHQDYGISPEAREHMERAGVKSGIGRIIQYQDECLAVLFIHQVKSERQWTEEEREAINIVTDQTAIAIHHAQLYERLNVRSRRQAKTAGLYRKAILGMSLDDLFNTALDLITEELGVKFAKIVEYVPDPDKYLLFRAVKGFAPEMVGQRFDPGQEPHSAYTLKAKEPIVVQNIYKENRFQPSPIHYQYNLVSGISDVIYGDKEFFGVLEADSQEKRHFDDNDAYLINAIASVIGVITERKKAETVIHKYEERFRRMVENVKEYAIYLLDPDGTISSWNPGACHLYGYTSEEAIGRHFSILLTPEDRDTGYSQYEIQTALQEGRFEDEGWRARKDGSRFWGHVVMEILHDDIGQVSGFTSITRDMTERKELERGLEEARKTADLANQRKSQALANMSHELRTPLNAIIGYSDMLLKGMGSTPEKQHRYLKNISTSGRHLLGMINEILDLSKVEAGKIDLAPEYLELKPVIYEVRDLVAPQAQARDIEVITELEPTLGGGHWDPTRLRQILLNLLSNAIKYNKEGGRVVLRLYKTEDRQWLMGEVTDTGIGIPKDQIKNIFQEFYRVNAPSQQVPGTGLGLTLTKKLIELQGGSISAESEEGIGSTFTFKLPVRTTKL